jgi:hypothetical protein
MRKLVVPVLAMGLLTARAEAASSGYGMVGLAAGETLRINVSDAQAPGAVGIPPGPCRAEVGFVDAGGRALTAPTRLTLRRGGSTHLDLVGDQLSSGALSAVDLPAAPRVAVRPVVLLPPGPCRSSIEIFDNATGKTLVTSGPQNPGVAMGFNPQPDPPKLFGPLGVVAGQTIRLNAVSVLDPATSEVPPGPCRVTLWLLDADGAVLARSTETLQPGAATFLDFAVPAAPPIDTNGGATAATSRTAVRAVVEVEGVGGRFVPPDPCRATLEIFDAATGRIAALASP